MVKITLRFQFEENDLEIETDMTNYDQFKSSLKSIRFFDAPVVFGIQTLKGEVMIRLDKVLFWTLEKLDY